MKMQLTKKQVRHDYPNIICIPYCGLQNLLDRMSPIGYTCGIYGWYSDVYSVSHDTVIVTGYQPFGNIHPPMELLEAYENKAKEVLRSYLERRIEAHERDTQAYDLVQEFASVCLAVASMKGAKRK